MMRIFLLVAAVLTAGSWSSAVSRCEAEIVMCLVHEHEDLEICEQLHGGLLNLADESPSEFSSFGFAEGQQNSLCVSTTHYRPSSRPVPQGNIIHLDTQLSHFDNANFAADPISPFDSLSIDLEDGKMKQFAGVFKLKASRQMEIRKAERVLNLIKQR